jgi:AcrR family transcriptional regulator
MRRRSENVDQTRQRIVKATVALHGTIGPAATTIAAIADAAGVTRLTVYRHFPDDDALLAACTAHWLTQRRPPDPPSWAAIADPEARLRAGLADLYQYYRGGADMLSNVYRDVDHLPASRQQFLRDRDRTHADLLTEPFRADQAKGRLVRAVVGHAVAFSTWQSLCQRQGLSDDEAIDVLVAAVLAVNDG